MNLIDGGILITYLLAMLGVGVYFMRKNEGLDDYFVGGRKMSSTHVGLSVVATDVGGGFSIGLGGLGFAIGLSGSWMLFTGLVGAWFAAVFLIPRVKKLEKSVKFYTFPQIFGHFFGAKVALLAALITTIGYLGFTASQLLAGAKLASVAIDGIDLNTALISMGLVAIVYTAIGGIKAVIYTDTIQWIVLMCGLIFVGIPVAHMAVGGWEGVQAAVAPEFLSFRNISWQQFLNWSITIIPIWFIGMTLYQRIYACEDTKQAQRAWFIAGLLEFPIIAIVGVLLGLYARVGLEQGLLAAAGYTTETEMDAELGMPLLLKTVLPTGLMGLVLASYFSAILSTADSCLMAASGSVVSDFIKPEGEKQALKLSQFVTLFLGIVALIIAFAFENVLSLMLYSYSFMVSGLLVPLFGALFFNRTSPLAATVSMITGGSITILFSLLEPFKIPFGLDPNLLGITVSAVAFIVLSRNSEQRGNYGTA